MVRDFGWGARPPSNETQREVKQKGVVVGLTDQVYVIPATGQVTFSKIGLTGYLDGKEPISYGGHLLRILAVGEHSGMLVMAGMPTGPAIGLVRCEVIE